MECPRCGLSNTEAARFCPGCGNALSGAPSLLYTERPPIVSNTIASSDRNEAMPHPPSPQVPHPPPPQVPRPAAGAVPDVFELVQRPEVMRTSTPDMTFPSRGS